MEEHSIRKVILLSLAGLLIGSLLFIFGVSLSSYFAPMLVNYFIALFLYISSFLAVMNANKKEKHKIYKFIMFLNIFFILLITVVFFTSI